MSDVGRKPAPVPAHELPEPAEEPRTVPSLDGDAERSQPLRDPMAFVRHERREAASRIGRSLAAWRKAKDGGGARAGAVPPSLTPSLTPSSSPASAGAPPPRAVRAAVEAETGADLSAARVHAGAGAAEAADRLGARAFTVGRDVHLGAGELRPGTREGDRLLAHELAHAAEPTAQVQRAPDPGKAPVEGVPVSQPHDPGEKKADAVADRATNQLHGGSGKPSAFQSRAEKSDQALDALGGTLSPEQAGAVGQLREKTRKLATDAVTGLSSRGMLSATLTDIIEHLGASDEQAFFVSADIKNLGGLNGTFGTSAANRHFRAMTDLFMQRLSSALGGARVLGYRLGGDEFGAVIVGHVDHGRVGGAVKAAEAAIDAYVKGTVERRLDGSGEARLADIDHPKHLGDAAYRGTGVIVADIQITPKMKPDDVLQVMDAVDLRKRASGTAEEGAVMAAAPKPPAPKQGDAQTAPTDPGKSGDGKTGDTKSDGKASDAKGDAKSDAPGRGSSFASGAERNDQAIAQLIAQLPPEQAGALRQLQQTAQRLATDAVTGLASRGGLTATLEDVIRFLPSSDEQAFFVSADIKNLGGLNGSLGTSAADRHFRAMTDLFQQQLRAALGGARVIGYRLGGDEFGAIVVGHVDGGRVKSAVAAADAAVRAYVQSARDKELATGKELRLADVEHPKHRGDAAYRGTGVVFADIQILPTMSPDAVLAVMDAVDSEETQRGRDLMPLDLTDEQVLKRIKRLGLEHLLDNPAALEAELDRRVQEYEKERDEYLQRRAPKKPDDAA